MLFKKCRRRILAFEFRFFETERSFPINSHHATLVKAWFELISHTTILTYAILCKLQAVFKVFFFECRLSFFVSDYPSATSSFCGYLLISFISNAPREACCQSNCVSLSEISFTNRFEFKT